MSAEDPVVIDIETRGDRKAQAAARKTGDLWVDAAGRIRRANGQVATDADKLAAGLTVVTRKATQTTSSLGMVGRGARGAATGVRNLTSSFNLGTIASAAAGYGVYRIGGGLLELGEHATTAGLQFNAAMEQNDVAFTQFLGSARAARTEMAWLTKEAAVTPFQLPQITTAARQLLAYNMSLKGTNAWLQTIADTTAGAGLGGDAITRLVTAIGQIKAKGFLQGDEMQQLGELGVLNRDKLAKDLNVTPLMLSSGNARIPADKALRAIKHQLDDTFGGQSAKQAKTFNGQLSNIKDNLNKTLGTITRPGFEYLRNKVFPAAGDATKQINKIFDRSDLNTNQKIQLSRQILDRQLGPFADALGDQISAAHIPEHIGDEFGRAIPLIASHMGAAAEPAASAFVTAWLHSGPWGQFLSAGWLAKKAGAFGAIGRALGGKAGLAGELAGRGSPTNPMYVIVLDQGVPGLGSGKGPVKKAGGLLEKLGPFAGPIGWGAAGGAAAGLGIGRLLHLGPFGVETAKPPTQAQLDAGRSRALADAVRRGNVSRADAMKPSRWTGAYGSTNIVAVLEVDGKKMAETVISNASNAAARRRGR